jgi:type VI protein secretion system component Hcp
VEDLKMSVDMFLEFDKGASIKGESIDKKFKDLLQIDSFDFGGELPASTEAGTGLGAGKVKFNEFNFKMKSSLASASCFKNMYTGFHIPSATLHLRKSGGGQKEYMTFKFKELMISKYSIDGGAEDPVESISFAYTGMYMIYNQQDQKGELVDKREAGWNVKENDEWLGS